MYSRGGTAVAVPVEAGEAIQPGVPRTLFTGAREVTSGDVLGDGNRFLVAVDTQARPRNIRLVLDWTAMLKR